VKVFLAGVGRTQIHGIRKAKAPRILVAYVEREQRVVAAEYKSKKSRA
jgi:hypothetical protein